VRAHRRIGRRVHCGARFEVVECLGDDQVVHLRVGDALVQAKIHADHRIEHGTDVVLAVPRERLALSDAESGERVAA
jgi:ABC-type sugar transport system ATPase subunit